VTAGVLSAGFPLVAEPIEKKRRPHTIVDAQFSMPFGAAVAILFGNAALDQYTLQNLGSEPVKALMDRVRCIKEPSLDAMFPERWPATAQIETHDGRRFDARVEYPKGDPENPLIWGEIKKKFLDLVGPILPPTQANEIIQMVENLDNLADTRSLMNVLIKTPSP
jgi:2-methylcitrate dehydratase PrpD